MTVVGCAIYYLVLLVKHNTNYLMLQWASESNDDKLSDMSGELSSETVRQCSGALDSGHYDHDPAFPGET